MKHKKIVSIVLSAALLCSGFAFAGVAGATAQEPEVVTESLSNYYLGSMSWGVKSMGLDKLQKKLETSGRELPEVRVAVIDTGLNKSNKYLKGRYTNDGYNFIDNTNDFNDDGFHGTMVSGIIADGTSSNVKILPLKTNDKNGSGTMNNVNRAIRYAIDHNADVINLSLSTSDYNHTINQLDDVIDEAVQRGIVVVVAAGNQASNTDDRYPANKDNVLTIASVDRKYRIAASSNTGEDVDFALPGVSVTAPSKRSININSGTSFSAPHAAAAAALLKTWDKSLNQEDIKEIMKQYSIDLGEEGFDNTYGWGMVNLSNFEVEKAETPSQPSEPSQPDKPKQNTLITLLKNLLTRKK